MDVKSSVGDMANNTVMTNHAWYRGKLDFYMLFKYLTATLYA